MAVDVWFLRIAVLYVIVGMGLGIAMGSAENFTYADVHAHINLVGWASMSIYALAYRAWPAMARSALAQWHFWIANAGALVLVIGIALIISNPGGAPVTAIIGSLITILGAILFAIIVWSRAGRA